MSKISRNIDRFSKFFHCWTQHQMCCKIVVPYPTKTKDKNLFEQLYVAHHERTTDRNNKLNNKLTIISIEQTAVHWAHHSNRHVALVSMSMSVVKTRLLMKQLITLFLPMCNLHTFKLPGYNL